MDLREYMIKNYDFDIYLKDLFDKDQNDHKFAFQQIKIYFIHHQMLQSSKNVCHIQIKFT